jgi:hypothetical protein
MFKKYLLALSLLVMPLTAAEAESGLVLKQHINANIEAFKQLTPSESAQASINILEKLNALNDARNNFFTAQKIMMEALASELKKLAEHIATLSKVEAALGGKPAQSTSANIVDDAEPNGSPLIKHIQDIAKHLEALPESEQIKELIGALEQIVNLEHDRHDFSAKFKQALETISKALGMLPEHMSKIESIKHAFGGTPQHEEGGEIANRE